MTESKSPFLTRRTLGLTLDKIRSWIRSGKPLESCAILYVAKYNPEKAPGIHKKISGTLKAAESIGYRVRNLNDQSSSMRLRAVLYSILVCEERYVFVRHVPESAVLIMPVLALARMQGKTIIVDVPNPNAVAIHEIWHQRIPLQTRIVRIAKVYLGGPFSLWPASRIVQHANESWWFSICNRARTIKLGNGVDPSSIQLRPRAPDWPSSELRLVAVATLTFWHGYDRLINAIAEWNARADRPYRVKLTLVGDGRARSDLELLTQQLGITDAIRFAGMQPPTAITSYYSEAHLAVGSLGIHRKGLRENPSELKAREYALAGIPFIACGTDADFPPQLPFRIVVSMDDSTDSIRKVFADFGEIRSRCTDHEINAFACEHLAYANKLRKLGLPDCQ